MRNILVLGLSKTGTTAISQAIQKALGVKDCKLYHEPTTFGLGRGKDELWHKKICAKGDVVTKCLVFPDRDLWVWHNIQAVAQHYTHVIWIDRDPRDRIISHNLYRWYHGHARGMAADRKENWESKFLQTLERVQRIEQSPGSLAFIDICETWWNPKGKIEFLKQQFSLYYSISLQKPQMTDWYTLCYQDFIDGDLGKLNEYLGVEVSNNIEVKQKRVVRTKGSGGWRDWFNEEDVRYLKPLYYYYLADSGYDPDDWVLNYPNSIDSAKGSEYMKKVHYDFQ